MGQFLPQSKSSENIFGFILNENIASGAERFGELWEN
jgi:hypothetical protein